MRDLSFEVRDGQLMVLVGPSGSGKTTALRMLAGLEAVDGGRIEIGSRVVNDVSPRDRDVAMVFQDYALYPQITVRDNMAFGLRRRGLARAEVDGRVAETCRTLGLDELLERRPRQLSGSTCARGPRASSARSPGAWHFVEALGRETLVGVDTDTGARIVAAVEGRAAYTVGEPIRVGLVAEGMRRFGVDGRPA